MKLQRRMQPNQTRRRRRGLSLAEVAISTLLVGLMVVTSMKAVGGVFRTWQVGGQQVDGAALAQELMTEVLQARYEEPDDTPIFGRETTEAINERANWDDTDDYDDWSASPPEAKDGTALANYSGWTRAVVVEKIDPSSFSIVADSAADTDLRRITVTVTDPQSRQTTLVVFQSPWGAVEQAPDVDTTFVTWVGIELQLSSVGTTVQSGSNIVNHAVDQ